MKNSKAKNLDFPSFSVAMCVYQKDRPDWFEKAIYSVTNQTVRPKELVLVIDGPISQSLENVIRKYKRNCRDIIFKVIRFKKNRGHGIARRRSVKECTTEIVALMDADDISYGDRFEQQLSKMLSVKADVVGGNISEFVSRESNIVAYRDVPVHDEEIKKYMKKRCPMNQMTVMFKKDAYDMAGGYRDWYQDEDYYLWIRMAEQGAKFSNTGTVLVNVRVGEDMYRRRGGIKYFKSEAKLQIYMLQKGMIGIGRCFLNLSLRLIVQVVLPNGLRGWLFCNLARRKEKISYGKYKV